MLWAKNNLPNLPFITFNGFWHLSVKFLANNSDIAQ